MRGGFFDGEVKPFGFISGLAGGVVNTVFSPLGIFLGLLWGGELRWFVNIREIYPRNQKVRNLQAKGKRVLNIRTLPFQPSPGSCNILCRLFPFCINIV